MPGLGSKLRIKRLALGLSLKDVSRKTRIKQKELEALEEEDVLRFKNKEIALDHIKTYSAALGLDRSEILTDFESLWSDSSTAKAYMQQQHKRENRFAAFREQKLIGYGAAVAAVAIFLSVGGYLFWNSIYAPGDPDQYYATSADDVATEEVATEELEVNDVEDVPAAQEGPSYDNDQEEIDFLADAEDDEVFDATNDLDEDLSEETAFDEEVEEEEQQVPEHVEEGLPQTGGLAYLIWFGLLTFIIGLALFLPALLFKKDYDPVLGPPY